MVAHQGESPTGELNPDLMAASGVEPDTHLIFGCAGKFQSGLFYTFSLFFDHKYLVFAAVLEE